MLTQSSARVHHGITLPNIVPASTMHGATSFSTHSAPEVWMTVSQQSPEVKPGTVEHPAPPHCPHPSTQQLFLDWMPTKPLLHVRGNCKRRSAYSDEARQFRCTERVT